jgi:hypothetical protein
VACRPCRGVLSYPFLSNLSLFRLRRTSSVFLPPSATPLVALHVHDAGRNYHTKARQAVPNPVPAHCPEFLHKNSLQVLQVQALIPPNREPVACVHHPSAFFVPSPPVQSLRPTTRMSATTMLTPLALSLLLQSYDNAFRSTTYRTTNAAAPSRGRSPTQSCPSRNIPCSFSACPGGSVQ